MPFELRKGQESWKMTDPSKVLGFLMTHAMQKSNPMFKGTVGANEFFVDFIGVGEKAVSVWILTRELLDEMVQEGLVRPGEPEEPPEA